MVQYRATVSCLFHAMGAKAKAAAKTCTKKPINLCDKLQVWVKQEGIDTTDSASTASTDVVDPAKSQQNHKLKDRFH